MKLKLTPGRLPSGMTLFHPVALAATWFGAGLIPFASGTWGSLAALPFAWVAVTVGGWPLLFAATIGVVLVGLWASGAIVTQGETRDPGLIVVDEVAGQFLALLLAPFSLAGWIAAFLLFRATDILKPFPAGWCDRHVHGGAGVMADDLVAGLYAGIAVHVLGRSGALDGITSFLAR